MLALNEKNVIISMKQFAITTIMLLISTNLILQSTFDLQAQPSQTIKGKVIDTDTQHPLVGAAIYILGGDGKEIAYGGTSDIDGYFRIENVPVGRHTIHCTFLGYEDWVATDIYVNSGKEFILNIELLETVVTTEAIVVTATKDKEKPLNPYTLVSTRAFSVEDVQRYPASINDPGRMAMGFPGVRMANQDNENSIVIRSNSPVGVRWRLEGIDIPNPNHFAHRGSSGGGISALSVNVLGQSDFSTGAFPAEYGNAFAGIMDMHFRKGNTEKREFRIQAGVVGLDAMMEGPISKKQGSSYLLNYRYSTLTILGAMGIDVTQPNMTNNFQDLSFNLYFPAGKKAYLNFWGLGGYSTEMLAAVTDTTEQKWTRRRDLEQYDFITQTGATGITHRLLLDDKSYLKTVLSATSHQLTWVRDTLNPINFVLGETMDEKFVENRFAINSNYNRKFNARWNMKTGLQASLVNYDYRNDTYDTKAQIFRREIDGKGNTFLIEPYTQFRYRPAQKLTFNFGLHGLLLTLNNTFAIDPRMAVQYQLSSKSALSLAYGLHSQIQPWGNYFLTVTNPVTGAVSDYPNMDLDMNKAHHIVLGYDQNFSGNIHLKAETYYQHLFNIPVTTDPNGTYYGLNGYDEFAKGILVNGGTGDNYGLDLTLEKFFSNNLFFLWGGSIYNSSYLANNGKRYNTRYNGLFNTSLMGGKEFQFKKNQSLEVGAKILYAGGRRFTPIDKVASAIAYAPVEDEQRAYESQLPNYFRTDLRLAYRKNRPKYYWMLSLDVQNLFNNQIVQEERYDAWLNDIIYIYQAERIPALSFTIDF